MFCRWQPRLCAEWSKRAPSRRPRPCSGSAPGRLRNLAVSIPKSNDYMAHRVRELEQHRNHCPLVLHVVSKAHRTTHVRWYVPRCLPGRDGESVPLPDVAEQLICRKSADSKTESLKRVAVLDKRIAVVEEDLRYGKVSICVRSGTRA
jgi:hypothetical protein